MWPNSESPFLSETEFESSQTDFRLTNRHVLSRGLPNDILQYDSRSRAYHDSDSEAQLTNIEEIKRFIQELFFLPFFLLSSITSAPCSFFLGVNSLLFGLSLLNTHQSSYCSIRKIPIATSQLPSIT